MSLESFPFVSIVGGFYNLDPSKAEEAKSFAKEIGAELAKTGMGLVVYFSEENSLEPHVVSGYVSAIPPGTRNGSIRVRFSESQKKQVVFKEEKERKELFDRKIFPGDDWETPFYRSLVAADEIDAVLLMAGSRSTLIAGQITVARSLPVLAIDRFEGSSEVIWRELSSSIKGYPSSATQNVEQVISYLKNWCSANMAKQELASQNEKHYTRLLSKKHKSWWAGLSFLVLMISVFFGISQAVKPGLFPILTFISMILSGATGALVRSVIWGDRDTGALTSLVLGGIAGFVVGLAYLIPQWVGAPGVLQPTTDVVTAVDKIQFVSAILVAISAGVGFDTVFSRMKKQAEEQAITPKV